MRLDFNVLWVDDQPQAINAQIEAIRKQMREHGFEFIPRVCKNLDEVKTSLAADEDVFTDEVDLVLVDWDLGGGRHGQEAIAEIRQNIRYKDVVFYSAHSSVDALRKEAFEAHLEGVYCASREDLVAEVMGVFDSLIKKVLDLDHTRGIVMGATSDIDYIVSECLVAIHDGADANGKEGLLKEAIGHVEEKMKELNEMAGKLRGAKSMVELFEAHVIFTANDRLRILSRILKKKVDGAGKSAREVVVKYINDVVPKRNAYGHLVILPEGKPTEIAGEGGKKIGIDEARQFRKLILDLRQDFRDLLKSLRGK